MYQNARHSGPPNSSQIPPPPPNNGGGGGGGQGAGQAGQNQQNNQFNGAGQQPGSNNHNAHASPIQIVNESCDRIKKEVDALQQANHSLRCELDKLHNEKAEVHKHFIMYYEMSYGLHLDVCKQKEIAKRLNNIIISILPIVSNEQQATIASNVDRAKQVSPEELNSIVDQQMREGYAAAELGAAAAAGHPMGGLGSALAGLPGLGGAGRPMPGTPGMGGMPGMHGLPPHAMPPGMHGLPHNLPPHALPPHGGVPPGLNMAGLPPQLIPQGLNMSSPPNAAGLLAMSGAPGLPGLGPAGLLAGVPGGGILPPHMMPKDNGPPPSSRNQMPSMDNPLSNSNNNNNNNNTFNHNKPPRNSIDSERRAASSSSATSDRDGGHRDGGHQISQLNDSKHHNSSKKAKRHDDSQHHQHHHQQQSQQQHQVMLNNSSSVSDDEKSEDLVVDGNDDRVSSPNSHHNGSTSPRENGSNAGGGGANSSMEWNQRSMKKERPLSRASSITSGCGPSGKERASPKTSGSHKTKSSPNAMTGSMADPMGALGPMMPGLPGYGRSMFPMGPFGPDGMPMPPMGPGGVKLPGGSMVDPYSLPMDSENKPRIFSCSPRVLSDPLVPKKAREVFSLDHGEVVCAVALSNPTRNVYTGGKGFVKVWSLDNSESNNEHRTSKTMYNPIAELACLPPDAYVRSCKLLPDGKKLIVGGEVPPISVWDLGNGGPTKMGDLKELATACYALAISPDSRTCITCFSDGTIGLYDVHNLALIGKFKGHEDGASCIDISSDGNTLWTGGLDTTLRSWNLNSGKISGEKDCVSTTQFGSQIFSLGCCPSGDYIAVGMENSYIQVMNCNSNNKSDNIELKRHESCVLALKFAASGKWFISTGKDKILNLYGAPADNNCPLIMNVSHRFAIFLIRVFP